MPASLTKRPHRCKISLVLTLLATGATAQPQSDTSQQSLRDCVVAAKNAAAINNCEQTWQTKLLQRVHKLNNAINNRLDTRQRLLFEQNIAAWKAFVERERAMIELSTHQRLDGLGPQLRNGAISQLYEQRERQLREHLHNLATRKP